MRGSNLYPASTASSVISRIFAIASGLSAPDSIEAASRPWLFELLAHAFFRNALFRTMWQRVSGLPMLKSSVHPMLICEVR